ncbi:FMN-binding protein [Streptomyces sp. MUM 2J]|uniref:FMN-binding protein n=1 Tax=Streptomyces sp. MUM 2J TaxID=2791987 RepID=UPI001F046E28|nr:FMN-binding protein [Streptomyces sp. MUM 2J]MCH0565592.1 FMN-binding protein [Streptomyces sp. MUM 2J]
MRKSHPVRRVVLTTAATVSGIVLLLSLKPVSGPSSAQAAGGALPQATATAQESPQGGARAVGSGTVTGEAARTQYGTVQVRITMSGGRITEAEAVKAPRGGRSDQISAMAVPRLNQEAVAAQSAQIDAVSGATYTSAGYRQSLQSALDRAKTEGPAGSNGSGGASATARTVTGDVARTQYGPVQVRVTVSGGRITRAEAVQAPQGGRSGQISADALPRLGREAVAAGNADIEAVSGATYTSAGYRQSLQSALDRVGG